MRLLDSKQYANAAKFARATIERDADLQRIVAPLLVNRCPGPVGPSGCAPRTTQADAASPRDALDLANEALTTMGYKPRPLWKKTIATPFLIR